MSQERRRGPHQALAASNHLSATIDDERPTDYRGAWSDANAAMANVANIVTSYARADYPAAEALESARHLLHLIADEVVDAEACRHPSPLCIIHRSPRYHEMLAEVGGRS